MEIIKELVIKGKNLPQIKPGDKVRVFMKSPEKEGKAQIFEGRIIAIDGGHQPEATFTVRRVSLGVGIERIFPLYSPLIQKIEVKKSIKVRRAKLYYLRKSIGKKVKLKEKEVAGADQKDEIKKESKKEEEEKAGPKAQTNQKIENSQAKS